MLLNVAPTCDEKKSPIFCNSVGTVSASDDAMKILQLAVQLLAIARIRHNHAQVTVGNQKVTNLLKKSAIEIVLVLECNPDTPNPSSPGRSAWHKVVLCEKNRINGIVATIATEAQSLANSFNNGILRKNV